MTYTERATVLGLAHQLASVRSVIGSVPNRLRRFREEQRTSRLVDDGAAPRFTYIRELDGTMTKFEYTAFSPEELHDELAVHGWKASAIRAESIAAEETVTGRPLLGAVDHRFTKLVPARMGYGLYFAAGRNENAT